MDIATLRVLQDIVRRESRSLLQYVSESFPWTTAGEAETLARVEQMAGEERAAAVALVNALARKRNRLPPYLGPFPMTFTSVNYATLHYLLPLLVDYQKQGIADLERDISRIADEEAAEMALKILQTKRRHLQALTDLAAAKV